MQVVQEEKTDTKPSSTAVDIGSRLFKYRDYTPLPLILLLFIFADPSAGSAALGMLSLVFGEIIRIYSVAFIGSISRTRKDRTGGKLIDDGPFALVRNPLYVGNFFITIGVAIFGGHLGMVLVTALLFATQYYFIVKYEEHHLQANFGPEYLAYCEKVPAWIPERGTDWTSLPAPPPLGPALKSEGKTLMAIVAMVVLLSLRG